jgi:bifunctional DNA-binding transcriptional regulator/antitoxin component of YhaV-PrlF toxin-antitoxin module
MATVQSRKIGDKYEQFLLPLPKKVCDSLMIKKGDELEVLVEGGDILLRKSGKETGKPRPKKEEPKKKAPITIESIMAVESNERKEIIEDAFKKGEIEEDMYREFGEWGWV